MVRQAEFKDLKEISEVHGICFPDSFSTHLGKGNNGLLQQAFYREYINKVPDLFLVAVDDKQKIVGFCTGYYMEQNNITDEYLKKNRMQIALRLFCLLITFNKAAWKKVTSVLFRKAEFVTVDPFADEYSKDETGDLLSICVMEDYRGKGFSQELIESFQAVLRKNNRKICLLTVALDNKAGVKFYEKNGFVPYREVKGQVRTYAKLL